MASASRNVRRQEPASSIWKYKAPPLRVGDERFKLAALPLSSGASSSVGPMPLDDMVTQFGWEDQSSEMTGTINLTDAEGRLRLVQGQEVACDWSPQADQPFDELWRLKIEAPEIGLQQRSLSLGMTTALTQANKGTENYSFRRDRAHPRGWLADQVARSVCGRAFIPVGKLAVCTHYITDLVQHATKPLDVIIKAYRAERVATGRLFFVYWDGRLNIVPLTPSEDLLLFAGAIIDAQLQEKLQSEFATALTIRGTTKAKERTNKKGVKHKVARTSKKIFVTVQSKAGIKQYGYVHREVKAPDAQTVEEARRYGSNLLRKTIKPERTLTVTVPVRPTLKRGDSFKVEWAAQGVTQVCYVAGLAHSVAPGSATTTITATFTDPFENETAKAAAEARKAKAKERGRVSGSDAPPVGGQTSRSKRRADQ